MTVTMTTAWALLMDSYREEKPALGCLCNLYTRDEPDLSTIRNRPEFNPSTFYSSRVRKSTHYRKAYGHYPERVLVDTIFRTRDNLRYCKEHGIHLNGPRLGKPPKDPAIRKQELRLEWLESGERGDIERRFGIGKRCYSLGRITAKLKHTSEVMIHMSVLTLNLQKRLRLLLRVIFAFFRHFRDAWGCA